MNNSNRYLPPNIRNYIATQAEEGEKYSKISEKVERKFHRTVMKGTISKIFSKFKETGSTEDLPRSGRPNLFTEEEQKDIIKASKKDRKLTATDISRDGKLNKPKASPQTICNLLNKEGLITSSSLPTYIPEKVIDKRLALALHYDKTPEIWNKVVFSDEAELYPYKSGKLFIRRYAREHPLTTYNMPMKWDPRSVKVWGCISADGVGPLVRYFDTLDNLTYTDILEENLIQYYPKLRGTSSRPGPLSFQQDNAKPHTAGNTIKWLKSNHIHCIEWPAYSPDLNPIENLWGLLQDKLYENNDKLSSSEDVWELAKKIWKNELNIYIPNLYKSMSFRVKEVIERKGHRLER